MTSSSDSDDWGFQLAEVGPFLAQHGISLQRAGGSVAVPAVKWPKWKTVMAALPHLKIQEAAAAFAGIDLHSPRNFSDVEVAELNRWQDGLRRAVSVKELQACEEPVPNGESVVRIEHGQLAAWCASKSFSYPLPLTHALPATDAGLMKELANLRAENARLAAQLADLPGIQQAKEVMGKQIDQLHADLKLQADALAKSIATSGEQAAELLSGKRRTTALQIIGGLLIALYRMDIHGSRLTQLGEILNDLSRAGVTLDEKTLRAWIKDSARVIERPRSGDRG
jgi:hypothetical protein